MTAYSGVRIVDFTSGITGPLATMLLSDFAADVIKVEPPSGDPWREHPGYLCWNRNKRRVVLDLETYEGLRDARRLLATADVAVFDQRPGELERLGLDAITLQERFPSLVHAWIPPYGRHGRWSQLPPADALRSAVTGGCFMQYSWEDVPVHLITPQHSYQHGIAAAGAIASALFDRARSGQAHAVHLSGLHAYGIIESVAAVDAPDIFRMRSPGARGAWPNYHLYQCADGEWLFLGTLMPNHFLKAIEVLDLFDILAIEGVDGDVTNIRLPEVAPLVVERLEERFAEKPREEWLDLLHDNGVPSAPVGVREEWFESETIVANGMRVMLAHPELGEVAMPGVPIEMHQTPGAVRGFMQDATLEELLADAPSASAQPEHEPTAATGLPLSGVRVLDLGIVVAGPHSATQLANFGADVIKVESLDGDSFRAYGLGFVGLNQGKRGISIDMKQDEARELLYDLVRQADVVVDNYRVGVLERLGASYETLRAVNPDIICCSVTGYGTKGPLARDPGFDPLLQARSGLMEAQGGDDEPVFHQIPINDTSSALMAAFGIATALHARQQTGKGQLIETCLANQSIICQSGDLVSYEGRPPAPRGGRDWPGETALRRRYQCSDGWIMLWCSELAHYPSLCVALEHPEWTGRMVAEDALCQPLEGETTERLAEAFSALTADDAIDRLLGHGVPAARVTTIEGMFSSPWFRANSFFWETDHPEFGHMTSVNTFGEWNGKPAPFPRRAPLLGEHTIDVLTELGLSSARIDELREAGAIKAYGQ